MEFIQQGSMTITDFSQHIGLKNIICSLGCVVGLIFLNREGERTLKYYTKMFLLFFISTACLGSAYEFSSKPQEESIFYKYEVDLVKRSIKYVDDGIVFLGAESVPKMSVKDFLKFCKAAGYVPSRTELIVKMISEKNQYNHHLDESEKILKKMGLFSDDLYELYQAARVTICTYAGGVNFIRGFAIAIIDYAIEKGYQTYTLWKEYSTHMYACEHHGEMFDFYMKVLKQLYGQ